MEIALLIGQLLLKYGPDVARGVQKIFSTPDPKLADWLPIFDMADQSYASLVPNSKLPPSPPA